MSRISLVAITRPLIGGTTEDFVAYAARVSNPTNQHNSETASKLLKYLVKNKHWSPFEMVHVVMEIECTRDIGRQILRHRSFSFQEFSQRYANVDSLGFELSDPRLQDDKNRQNSIETDNEFLNTTWKERQELVKFHAIDAYDWAIYQGIAKEVARKVLPEGLTMSRMYMSGSLRSWLHYCQIRTDVATQKEHREVALAALEILKEQFPSISELI